MGAMGDGRSTDDGDRSRDAGVDARARAVVGKAMAGRVRVG